MSSLLRNCPICMTLTRQPIFFFCAGVVDCPDFSDELYCKYCPEHHFHCGVGQMCVPKDKMCDGIVDCDNGADEKGCRKFAAPASCSCVTNLPVPLEVLLSVLSSCTFSTIKLPNST